MYKLKARRALLVAVSSAALVAGPAEYPTVAAAPDTPQVEKLDRGLISVHTGNGNFLSWRLLAQDAPGTAFNVYRDGRKVTATPITRTNFVDSGAAADAVYTVRPVVNEVEQTSTASAERSLRMAAHTEGGVGVTASTRDVPLQIPPGGSTPSGSYTYEANDGSVGDLDGDGQYEIVLKWQPTNAKDNAQSGYTGNTIIDAYKLDGRRLWRIDLGRNIRSGAHYTQFQVYDYDGDGKAEVAMKTADGTKDGTGKVIGSASADHRNSSGYIITGPEYLTVFNGLTGAVMSTVNFEPARGNICDWGDCKGNRGDRFLAGTAYLDGQRPSLIMGRGYYEKSTIAAWDFRNGQLTLRWKFDSGSAGRQWTGRGTHSLSIADVDANGTDEIIYGGMTINANGTGRYTTNFYAHGDALHVGDFVPSRSGKEIWQIHEQSSGAAATLRDANNGRVIMQKNNTCNCEGPARGVAGDVYAGNAGAEFWGRGTGLTNLFNSSGGSVGRTPGSANFVIWWDGDAQRELLDGTHIDKYGTSGDTRLLTGSGVASNNGTKSTPVLQADILGDWREEVIWRTSDNRALRIYSTTDPTSISRPSLMRDRQYRLAVAWQNTAYNQPPHPSFATP
ncbi:rhamnogalacturonan lyase [Streptomyces sp. KR80]|uniref:rhamnogalacturonan lyase n=1 Tax=Streptomyces sp. KR80 TaxID=3457426 RepID=UPI003FD2F0F8